MELGTFSVSLSVADLAASRSFYETLGFSVYDGVQNEGWLIMQNGATIIGLFRGMFEGNLLTFNPADARAIERTLRDRGIEPTTPTEGESGPTHLIIADPDGNVILIDQHDADYTPNPQLSE